MIPTLGVMIGFYIVTKMISLGTRKDERAESASTRIMALLTIIVAVVGMVSLVTGGAEVGRNLGQFMR